LKDWFDALVQGSDDDLAGLIFIFWSGSWIDTGQVMMVSLKPDIVRQSDEVGEGLNENGRFAKRLLGAIKGCSVL
jgi:hypothetical protein